MSVLYKNLNRWTEHDEIWYGGGPWGREGSWEGFNLVPHPPEYRVSKGGLACLWSLRVCFGINFMKQMLQGTPNLVGVGHLFWPQIWIWKDLGPMSWSHGHSLWREVHKINSAWSQGQANVWLSQHSLVIWPNLTLTKHFWNLIWIILGNAG